MEREGDGEGGSDIIDPYNRWAYYVKRSIRTQAL